MLESNVLLFYAFNLELAVVVRTVQNVPQHEESHLHTQHCTQHCTHPTERRADYFRPDQLQTRINTLRINFPLLRARKYKKIIVVLLLDEQEILSD